ncbi:MAG: hypothetical protein AAGF59_09700 [Pseudomonadota bacterium]
MSIKDIRNTDDGKLAPAEADLAKASADKERCYGLTYPATAKPI